jgi:hypothetical protein
VINHGHSALTVLREQVGDCDTRAEGRVEVPSVQTRTEIDGTPGRGRSEGIGK